jgi:ankyrin repeat protein
MSKEGPKELAAAAREGKLDEVERMLAAGLQAQINEQVEFGGTALVQACASGELAVAQRLLRAGADIEATTAVREVRVCVFVRARS